MSQGVILFDIGKQIGTVNMESKVKEGALIEITRVIIDNKYATILHLLGLNYGIVIPDHIAAALYSSNQKEIN